MAVNQTNRIIDDRIKQVSRDTQRIDNPFPKAYTFKELSEVVPFSLANVKYRGLWFNEEQSSPPQTATSSSAFQIDNTGTTNGTGVSEALGQYTVSGATWTVDEWAGFWLTTTLGSFQIRSNDATGGIVLMDSTVDPYSGNFTIYAHGRDIYNGLKLQPDTGIDASFFITGTTENSILVENTLSIIYAGSVDGLWTGVGGTGGLVEVPDVAVGTGDIVNYRLLALPQYGNVVNLLFAGLSSTNFLGDTYTGYPGWTIRFLDGDAQGQTGDITAFDSASGHFSISGISATVATGDTFVLEANVSALSGGTYAVVGGHYLTDYEFINHDPDDLRLDTITSVDGDFNIDDMTQAYTARYMIDFYAKTNVNIPLRFNVDDSTYRLTVNGSTQLKGTQAGSISVNAGWNRIGVYIYSEWGGTFSMYGADKPIGRYFSSWRDTTVPAPSWSALSGYNGSPPEANQITLSWINSGLLTQEGGTEIWSAPSGSTGFTLVERLFSTHSTYTHTSINASTYLTYKLRHFTAQGNLSDWSTERTATTAPEVGQDGLALVISTDSLYYTTGDTIAITVTAGSEGTFVGLDGEPIVKVGGSLTTYGSSSSDGYHTSSSHSYDVTGGDSQGLITIGATGTTIWGETITGTLTVGLDFVAPTVTAEDLILDSDDNISNGTSLYCTFPNRVYVHPGPALVDTSGASGWASGISSMKLLNALYGSFASVGAGYGIDTSLSFSDWSAFVGSFNGYILTDSLGAEFNVTTLQTSSGYLRINVTSGTPATGAFTISKYSVDSPVDWTSKDFNGGSSVEWDLTVEMPYSQSGIPDSLDPTRGFRVYRVVYDNAGNGTAIVNSDIHYNPYATNAPILTSEFRDTSGGGGSIATTNENGWFNDTNLYLRITAEAPDSGMNVTSIWTSINGASFVEHVVNATSGSYDLLLTENAYGTVDFYAETNAMAGAPQTQTVQYKYDKTIPTWTPSASAPVGGFNRVILGWASAPADTLSGPWQVEIYRHTADVSGSSSLIGTIDYSQTGFIDSEIVQSQNYYYWGKAVDYAGNKSGYLDLGGPIQGEAIVPADVDGALRIESPTNNTSLSGAGQVLEWVTRYGIRVPIEAVTIDYKSDPGNPEKILTMKSVEYSADGSSWTPVSSPTVVGSGITIDGYAVRYSEKVTIAFTPVQDKGYWKVTWNRIDADETVDYSVNDVHFDSLLAADLIVAGVLRLETGLTVWSGSYDSNGDLTGGGVGLDTAGMFLWDASGNTTVALYGTPDGDNNIGVFGRVSGRQMTIDEDGNVTLDGGSLTVGNGTNLCRNSNFSAGIINWTIQGNGFATSATGGLFGPEALEIDYSATTGYLISDPIYVDNSRLYLASMFYKKLSAWVSMRLELMYLQYTSADAAIGSVSAVANVTTGTTDWQRMEGELPALNSTCAYVVIAVRAVDTGASQDIEALIDGIQLEEISRTGQTASPWSPAGVTVIDGGIITTGIITSNDGSTYFDLDNDKIIMNDGTGSVEISSAEGMVGTYDGRDVFNLGIKSGNAFFRGGVLGSRLGRIPELANALGYTEDNISSRYIDTSSLTGDINSIKFAYNYLWAGGSQYLLKIDRFGAHTKTTYTTGIVGDDIRDVCYVGGNELWTISSYFGSGGRGSSNQRNLRKWDMSDGSSTTPITNLHTQDGGWEGQGMAYDPVTNRIWLSSYSDSPTRLYYIDLSNDTLSYVTVTGKYDTMSAGIAFDGKHIWFASADAGFGGTDAGRLHRWDVAAATGTYIALEASNFLGGDVIYDGLHVVASNVYSASVDRFHVVNDPFATTPTRTKYITSLLHPYGIVFNGRDYYCFVNNTSPKGFYRFDPISESFDLMPITFADGGQVMVHSLFDGEGVWMPQQDRISLVT